MELLKKIFGRTNTSRQGESYNLNRYVEPFDQLLATLAIVPVFVLSLGPNLSQAVIILLVDTACLAIVMWLDPRIFPIFLKDTEHYCPKPVWRNYPDSQKALLKSRLLASINWFPVKRFWYNFFGNLLKIAPPIAFGVAIVDTADSPKIQVFAMMYLACLPINLFFAGSVYLYSHKVLSEEKKKIEQIPSKLDQQLPKNSNFYGIPNLIVVLTFASTLLLQFLLGTSRMPSAFLQRDVALNVSLTSGAICFLLILRLWWNTQNVFESQLVTLVSEISIRNLASAGVPIHESTIGQIQTISKEFNFLLERINQSEKDLHEATIRRVEEMRFTQLGETAALIAHDLSSPLHAIQFYTEELLSKKELTPQSNLISKISLNSNRAIELLKGLKYRVRNTSPLRRNPVSIIEIHQMVTTLIRSQLKSGDNTRIEFLIDPSVSKLDYALDTTDLLHIFDNLYRNATDHIVQKHQGIGKIETVLVQESKDFSTLAIRNSGTAFSADDFKRIVESSSSLGLKLTKRLIEKKGGKLEASTDSFFDGTTMLLTIPKSLSNQEHHRTPLNIQL